MQKESRAVFYDPELQIEAYYFKGIVQAFPDHFHEHYVIGAIESGRRWALTDGEQYMVEPGDLVIFNPHAVHACRQVGEYPLDWRCLNVGAQVMERTVECITGRAFRPKFEKIVLYQSELAGLVRELFSMIAGQVREFSKEEAFLLLIEQLLEECGGFTPPEPGPERPEVKAVCAYLEAHYGEPISLEQLSALAGLSKYYLLRCFTRQKGISPYRYLENVRIDRAKRLLEQGAPPVEAALQTGFSDQSHFTNFFKALIGLTPSQYRAVFRQGEER